MDVCVPADRGFEAEINCNNPLGTGGRLAIGFAVLLRALWKGTHHAFQPSKLKVRYQHHERFHRKYLPNVSYLLQLPRRVLPVGVVEFCIFWLVGLIAPLLLLLVCNRAGDRGQ